MGDNPSGLWREKKKKQKQKIFTLDSLLEGYYYYSSGGGIYRLKFFKHFTHVSPLY